MSKSEAQTRAELIDQRLAQSGWSVKDPMQVVEEFDILTALPEGVAEPRTPYEGHQFSDYALLDNIAIDGQMASPFRMWITVDKYDDLAAYSVQDGDIIISRAGTVGKMCVTRMNGQPAIISTNLIRLRLGSELRPLHFVSLMLYCKGRVGRLKTGPDGAFTHMNTGVLDSLEFPYPSVGLQDRFGEIAKKVESVKSRYQQSLTDLEALYGALSQQAFKGELDLSRVPLPGIEPKEKKPW